ncbi:PP2C family protein-serine/threonine phosphatase [Larsenimonas rhizosphaerae]|uniref:SpoIIE family protein phosphatase n=1 Tax=Larsenimonas rhizosphaerae TaxID=2944682 RepID=A0AA41ZP52_9GAMM|nr:SpoIIE family protein phosphatase [Larsenimonas rhizosphaerae]MCM2131992.1 SpoIIE family protein phosphatase [Larsenimonas rhizosphaerae]MCX2524595.1 SpoIIE family protein phosphatase [Larsenimonas rhizosphaerae]
MMASRPLIGVVDRPGPLRNQLVELLIREGFEPLPLDDVAGLSRRLSLIVVHVTALEGRQWDEVAQLYPTLAVSERYYDHVDVVTAIDAGVEDYLIDPMANQTLFLRLVQRALDNLELRRASVRDRDRLETLNEQLQTHLTLLREDLYAGGQIQRKLLPLSPAQLNSVSASYWLAPSLYLSGDFLDYRRLGEHYSLFSFIDVSGHGASSAFVTVLIKSLIQRSIAAWDGERPEALLPAMLDSLNFNLLETGVGKHASVLVGMIDRRDHALYYALGAQMPMPFLKEEASVSVLEGEGPPIGLFPGVNFPVFKRQLAGEFSLWLCSDGVFDCLHADTLDEKVEMLRQRVAQSATIADLKGSLVLGDALPDDLTIMMLSGFHDD